MIGNLRIRAAVLLAALSIAAGAAAEPAPWDFVPAAAEYTIVWDAVRLRSMPVYTSFLQNDPRFRESADGLEKEFGVRFEDLDTVAFVGGGKTLRGTLFRTKIPEARLTELLRRAAAKQRGTLAPGRVGAYPVQILTFKDVSLPKMQRKLVFLYLAPEILLVTEEEYVAPYLKALAQRKKIAPPEKPSIAWALCDMSVLKTDPKHSNPMADSFAKSVRRVYARIDLAGAGHREFEMDFVADCKDANKAATMSFILPSAAMLLTNFLFLDDPKLGEEVLGELRPEVRGRQASLRLHMSEDLTSRVGNHIATKVLSRIAAPLQDELGEAETGDSPAGTAVSGK